MPAKRATTPRRSAAEPKSKAPSRSRSNTPSKATPKASPQKTSQKASPQKASPKAARIASGLGYIGKIDPIENERRRKFTPERDQWDGTYEFTLLSCIGIMVFSHVIMYYFWICIEFYGGDLVYPGHPRIPSTDIGEFFNTIVGYLITHAIPTMKVVLIFGGFQLLQYILAAALPGPVTYGLPLPSENNYHMPYKCNGTTAWYIILAAAGFVQYFGFFDLVFIRDNFARFLTCAIILGDATSVICFVAGFIQKRTLRMTGNWIYDFFMGSTLNPRLPGGVDLKLWAEIRNSWVLLFCLTLSNALKMYQSLGYLTPNMWFIVIAHFIYANACQKGEECITTTWDIFSEKFGWMLIFWNFAGVPFLYCFQSLYIQTINPDPYPTWVMTLLFIALFVCYYIWDTMNSQKNRFRMDRQGVDKAIVCRRTFPQLPWGYIEHPETLTSEDGRYELFVDGWYRYARKLHYTVDLCMSFMWGLSCGVNHFIPFFYFLFFFCHLTHRQARDDERCRKKYGALWTKYTERVPYKFIPGIY